MGKTEIFAAGVSTDLMEEIVRITGFKVGHLLVRYLGVPLVTRKLSIKDCEPLIRVIKERTAHWSVRFLSFAGRVQLIQSVLFSIQVYWCRHFLLPKGVLKHINQLVLDFYGMGRSIRQQGLELAGIRCVYPNLKVVWG